MYLASLTSYKTSKIRLLLTTSFQTGLISGIDIKAGYKPDHSMLNLSLLINNVERGRGIWKLNTYLLKDYTYLTLVKTVLWVKNKYAVPVYNLDNINEIGVDFDVFFLEMIQLRIRGKQLNMQPARKQKFMKLKKS